MLSACSFLVIRGQVSQPDTVKLAYLKLSCLWMLCNIRRRHLTRCLHVWNKKQRVMKSSIEDEWQDHDTFVLPKLVYQVAWEFEHIVSIELIVHSGSQELAGPSAKKCLGSVSISQLMLLFCIIYMYVCMYTHTHICCVCVCMCTHAHVCVSMHVCSTDCKTC
jgi:hypothetical protein